MVGSNNNNNINDRQQQRTSNPSSNPIVRRFMSYRKKSNLDNNDDEKWHEKAVISLVKKLKKSKMLAEFERALSTNDPTTECVTILRSLDGRLQVSQRKCLPHVTYCKMWRFPTLQSHHQLRSLSHCKYPFSQKLDYVCINPYHMQFVDSIDFANSNVATSATTNTTTTTSDEDDNDEPLRTPKMEVDGEQCVEWTTTTATIVDENDEAINFDNVMFPVNVNSSGIFVSTNNYSCLASVANTPATVSAADNSSSIDPFSPNNTLSPVMDMISIADVDNAFRTPLVDCFPSLLNDVAGHVQQPACSEPQFWCVAYYYELNQRVGEPFKGCYTQLVIDGFCSPSDAERFCLGALANVNRNPSVVNARRQIGRGARVFRRGGDIFVECLSEAPIFVQSPIHAVQAKDHPATVYRIPPGNTMQIFDRAAFEELLRVSSTQGFDVVYNTTRMCHVRISFVKGWGEQYRRQQITATPCWIELHLPGPLQWLDRVLSTIGTPSIPCTSFT